ncbi:MAG: dipicolinate synthase subunit B [Ruminococcus sp.]|nr:dipicolinate synthase subunit B [Ruminococcus sp.]
MSLEGIKIGFAVSGSFCTFHKAFEQARRLKDKKAELTPIFSFNAASIDTRFGKAADNISTLENICGSKAILTLEDAEPIGPKRMFDIFVIVPCTATTMGKLANAIYDTPVTLGAKSHLRSQRPVLICASTNDALSASAKNIGTLLNFKHFFFVPIAQDDCETKPRSLSADFDKLPDSIEAALKGFQLQPIFF